MVILFIKMVLLSGNKATDWGALFSESMSVRICMSNLSSRCSKAAILARAFAGQTIRSLGRIFLIRNDSSGRGLTSATRWLTTTGFDSNSSETKDMVHLPVLRERANRGSKSLRPDAGDDGFPTTRPLAARDVEL